METSEAEVREVAGKLTAGQKNGIARLVVLFEHERDFAKAHGWSFEEDRRGVSISKSMGIQLQDRGLAEFRHVSTQGKSFTSAPTDLGKAVATYLKAQP